MNSIHPPHSIFGFGACVVHSRSCIPAVIWLTTQWTTCSRQGIYTPYEYCLQVSWHTRQSSVLHYANFPTKEQQRQQSALFSPSDHTTQRAALYILHAHCAAMIHLIQCNDTRLCSSGTCKRNNLRLRYSNGEGNIEDRDRDLGDLDIRSISAKAISLSISNTDCYEYLVDRDVKRQDVQVP